MLDMITNQAADVYLFLILELPIHSELLENVESRNIVAFIKDINCHNVVLY